MEGVEYIIFLFFSTVLFFPINMRKLGKNGQTRNRQKNIKSKKRLVNWARKQQQRSNANSIPFHLISSSSSISSASLSNQPLRCPLVNCSGTGHLNGIEVSHITLSGCPTYHNLSFEKCAEMRAREDGLVSPAQAPPSTTASSSGPQANIKASHSTTSAADRPYQFRTSTREPLLDADLASPMEIYQFRCAQQQLVADRVSFPTVICVFVQSFAQFVWGLHICKCQFHVIFES